MLPKEILHFYIKDSNMKKVLHTTILSVFLLASTQVMAAPAPSKQYDDLRKTANMSQQQAQATEAGKKGRGGNRNDRDKNRRQDRWSQPDDEHIEFVESAINYLFGRETLYKAPRNNHWFKQCTQ